MSILTSIAESLQALEFSAESHSALVAELDNAEQQVSGDLATIGGYGTGLGATAITKLGALRAELQRIKADVSMLAVEDDFNPELDQYARRAETVIREHTRWGDCI